MPARMLLFFSCVAVVFLSGLLWAESVQAEEVATGEYIVQFAAGESPDEIAERMERESGSGFERLKEMNTRFDSAKQRARTWRMDELRMNRIGGKSTFLMHASENVDEVLAAWKGVEGVEAVMPNYLVYPTANANDVYYGQQWNLNQIQMSKAWDVTDGSSQVRVAIIDSGIETSHEDIRASRIVDDYDFVNQDGVAEDEYGHGTMVAGVIMAESNNGKGVAGIDSQARVLNYKVLSKDGPGKTSWMLEAIDRSLRRDADVINLSLAIPLSCDFWALRPLRDLLDEAAEKEVLVVAAAGNDGKSASHITPASCDGVVTVGASDMEGDLANYSSYGSVVEIVAPGGDKGDDSVIPTTGIGNSYKGARGTSFAAAHVTGVAALIKGLDMNLRASDVSDFLIDSGDDFDNTWTDAQLNAFRAVTWVKDDGDVTPEPTPKPEPTPTLRPTLAPTTTPTPTLTPTPTQAPQVVIEVEQSRKPWWVSACAVAKSDVSIDLGLIHEEFNKF